MAKSRQSIGVFSAVGLVLGGIVLLATEQPWWFVACTVVGVLVGVLLSRRPVRGS